MYKAVLLFEDEEQSLFIDIARPPKVTYRQDRLYCCGQPTEYTSYSQSEVADIEFYYCREEDVNKSRYLFNTDLMYSREGCYSKKNFLKTAKMNLVDDDYKIIDGTPTYMLYGCYLSEIGIDYGWLANEARGTLKIQHFTINYGSVPVEKQPQIVHEVTELLQELMMI